MPADYFTAQDVKEYLEITGTSYDTILAKLVIRASRWIDNFCQHPLGFDHETITNENLRGRIDNDGNLVLAVKKATANSVSALSWGTNPTNLTALDTNYCWADWGSKTGYVIKWLGGGLSYYRRYPIIVQASYDGGYTPVPDELVHAGITMAARVFKSRQAGFADVVGSVDTGTLMFSKLAPSHVLATLGNYTRRAPW